MDAVESTGFAIERGYRLNNGEQLVRSVINRIMCNGLLDLDEIATEFGSSVEEVKKLVAFDPAKFESYISDGLMQLDGNKICLSDKGFLCARNIAMVLDPALKAGEGVYSKTV